MASKRNKTPDKIPTMTVFRFVRAVADGKLCWTSSRHYLKVAANYTYNVRLDIFQVARLLPRNHDGVYNLASLALHGVFGTHLEKALREMDMFEFQKYSAPSATTPFSLAKRLVDLYNGRRPVQAGRQA